MRTTSCEVLEKSSEAASKSSLDKKYSSVVTILSALSVTSGSEWVRTSENKSRVSRDLASAYVLCLHTFVVPNLWRDEGKSLGKEEQIGRLRKLTRMNEVDF